MNGRRSSQPASLTAASSDRDNEYCFVFIDNSNLTIPGRQYFAEKQHLLVKQDNRWRIDMGNLTVHLVGGRSQKPGHPTARFYGSEPPPIDTVWRSIREQNISVEIFNKNQKGNEKCVDTALVDDLRETECDVSNSKEQKSATFIIVSGDIDYQYSIKKLLRNGYKVELVSWKSGLSKDYPRLAKTNTNLTIRYLDDLFEGDNDFSFFNLRWRNKFRMPRERTIVVQFERAIDATEAEIIVRYVTERFALPFLYRFKDGDCSKLFLVISARAQVNKRGANADDDDDDTETDDFSADDEEDKEEHEFKRTVTTLKFAPIYDFTALYVRNVVALREFINAHIGAVADISTLVDNIHSMQQQRPNAAALNGQPSNYYHMLEDSTVDTEQQLSDDDDHASFVTANGQPGDAADATAEDVEEDAEEQENFTVVEKRAKKCHQQFSKPCPFSFWCQCGARCTSKHTDREREFFKMVPDPRKRKGYKTKPCLFREKGSQCRHERADEVWQCGYAHGEADAFCSNCHARGVHFAYDCPDKCERPVYRHFSPRND